MQHLAGNDGEPYDISSGPGPDPNKPTLYSLNKHSKGYQMKGTASFLRLTPKSK